MQIPNTIQLERGRGPAFVASDQPLLRIGKWDRKILAYGATLNVDGFSCGVEESGVSCKDDASGDAFSFSTNGYRFTPTAGGTPTPAPATPVPVDNETRDKRCGTVTNPRNGGVLTVVIKISNGPFECSEAESIFNEFLATVNDRTWNVRSFQCVTHGAVEAERLGYGVDCQDSSRGATLILTG